MVLYWVRNLCIFVWHPEMLTVHCADVRKAIMWLTEHLSLESLPSWLDHQDVFFLFFFLECEILKHSGEMWKQLCYCTLTYFLSHYSETAVYIRIFLSTQVSSKNLAGQANLGSTPETWSWNYNSYKLSNVGKGILMFLLEQDWNAILLQLIFLFQVLGMYMKVFIYPGHCISSSS